MPGSFAMPSATTCSPGAEPQACQQKAKTFDVCRTPLGRPCHSVDSDGRCRCTLGLPIWGDVASTGEEANSRHRVPRSPSASLFLLEFLEPVERVMPGLAERAGTSRVFRQQSPRSVKDSSQAAGSRSSA